MFLKIDFLNRFFVKKKKSAILLNFQNVSNNSDLNKSADISINIVPVSMVPSTAPVSYPVPVLVRPGPVFHNWHVYTAIGLIF
jgi:hypothetical protein